MRSETGGSSEGVKPWAGIEGDVWRAVNSWTDVEFWGIKLTDALRYDLQQVVYRLLQEAGTCDPAS